MITGFNTDIKHEGVTYHVQTEDKGLKTPLILSLVYQGGTILASKRSPYEDLAADFDEKVLEDRLNRQHNLICAAIRAGRIEDLKRMTLEASSGTQKAASSEKKSKKEIPKPKKTKETFLAKPKIEDKVVSKQKAEKQLITVPPIETKKEIDLSKISLEVSEKISKAKESSETSEPQKTLQEAPTPKKRKPFVEQVLEPEAPSYIASEKVESDSINPEKIKLESNVESEISKSIQNEQLEAKIPKPTEEPVWDIPIIEDVTIVEESDINEEEVVAGEIILPPEAVEIVGDLEQFGSLLENELKVKILGETQFKSGDRKNINILVCRGSEDSSVADASVMVKVIGSDFRPLIYHAKADSNGVATVFLKLPSFRSGRAALLIRAMVDGEETELRRAISPE